MNPLRRSTDTAEDLKATVASVSRSVWAAKFTLLILKPVQYMLTMAYFAALLYGGTWIVVLALRHSGALR